MPLKSGKLTDQESVFVQELALTGDKTAARVKAGYVSRQSEMKANEPWCREAVRERRMAFLDEAVPLAHKAILDCLQPSMAPGIRSKVALAVKVMEKEVLDEVMPDTDAPVTLEELDRKQAAAERLVEMLKAAIGVQVIDVTPQPEGDFLS